MASLLFSCRDLPAANQSAVVGAAADDPSSVDSIATAAAVADPAETTTTDVAGLCPDDSVTDAVWFYLPPSASVFVLFFCFAEHPSGVKKKGQQLSTTFLPPPPIPRDRLRLRRVYLSPMLPWI